ncbi:helix-turn-helix domain-containing protein [Kitasatospora viridis]|nr:helix-turn-helix transcriptional regulator [Kitasatospora viridis]
MSENLGAELRRLRLAAGLSLTQLGERLSYSKGHLSKIERGQKTPPVELVRRCDALLRADGRLIALAPAEPVRRRGGAADLDRRQALAVGAGSLLALGLGTPAGVPAAVPTVGTAVETTGASTVLGAFRIQFDQMRRLGQVLAPGELLPMLTAHTDTLAVRAAAVGDRERRPLLVLASRYAEFAGWMAQEAGDDATALRLTGRAVDLAEAGGDRDLAGYALVRRGLISCYAGDSGQTVGLAQLAQHRALPTRIRGLAAQREAQGHALAGDRDACLRSLDLARTLLARADERDGSPTLGTTNLPDPAAVVAGWCLHDLGRPHEAAEVLDRECARIAPEALRTRTRFGIRRALAHAAAGEVEHACALAAELLAPQSAVPSATVALDIRRLARELSRFPSSRAVRELQPALVAALAH